MRTTNHDPHRGWWFVAPRRFQFRLRSMVVVIAVIALVWGGVMEWINRRERDRHSLNEARLRQYIAKINQYVVNVRANSRHPASSDREQARLDFEVSNLKSYESIVQIVRPRVEQEAALKAKFERRLLWPY